MSEDKPTVVLVDLSSIAHQIYHISASEPDPDYTSKQTVTRVHALASGHEHVAVCCDSGRSFRRDVSPDYKANRPERDEILMHQIALVREQLVADGFPVWAADGFEADDLLASACAEVRAVGHPVLIVTGDKDILCLVTDEAPAVTVKSVQTGAVLDTEGVVNKLGVLPAQMVDYLSLVGDTSDNIKGAKGIGPKGAAALLKRFGTLDDLFRDWDETGPGSLGLTPAVVASLQELRGRLTTVRALITLRLDVPPMDVKLLLTPRVPPPMAGDEPKQEDAVPIVGTIDLSVTSKCDGNHGGPRCADPECWNDEPSPTIPVPSMMTAKYPGLIPVTTDVPTVEAALVPYERQLDPRTMPEAILLAKDMFTARNFAGAASPQTALATIMMGRELGIPAMTALRIINVIDGRHSLSAQAIVGLCLRSGLVEYVEPVEISPTSVTYRAKRKDRPELTLTHTIEMAQQAGLVKPKSGWEKNPVDMLVSRCSARICRIVAPDVCANLYTQDELIDIRESNRG